MATFIRTPLHGLRALLRRHPLVSFFVLAFAFTWAIMIPLVLASHGLIDFPQRAIPLLILMGYGPTLAALLVSWAVGGWTVVRELLSRLRIWRVGWAWWAIAVFLNGAVVLTALGLYALLGNPLPPFPSLAPGMLVMDIVLTFLISGLINGEEMGWRGFATPRLLQRYGAPVTVLVLGTLQTLFHLPIFFNNGASAAGGQNGTPFLAFATTVVLAVVLFTWLYQHTRGSVLIAIVFHASMNTWTSVLPFPATSPTFVWVLAAVQAVVVALVLARGAWQMKRHASAPSRSSLTLATGS